MRLPHLKRIYIANVCVSLLLLFQWIRVQLPSLEYISFVQTKFILDTFHRFTDTVGCQKTLKDITVQCCAIDESLLETILFDVLPNFPTVSFLRLWNNNIRSLRSFVQRLDNSNDNRLVYKSALYYLDLHSIRSTTCISDDSEERANMCRFLRAFSTIGKLDGIFSGRGCIDHELALNRAGRRLIEGRDSDHPIPLSLWPTVLGRRKMVDATGLFYFLRNGPVLLGRYK
jgi:hypothetical protein